MVIISSPASPQELEQHPARLFQDPAVWQKLPGVRWHCLLCGKGTFYTKQAQEHQDSREHVRNARARDERLAQPAEDLLHDRDMSFVNDLHLELSHGTTAPLDDSLPSPTITSALPLPFTLLSTLHGPAQPGDALNQSYDNWASEVENEYESDPIVGLHGTMWDSFGASNTTESQMDEATPDPPVSHPEHALDPIVQSISADHGGLESQDHDALLWYPWDNRQSCSFDLLWGFPRTVWSQSELDVVRWLLRRNDVHGIPSVKTQSRGREKLREMVGSNAHTINGSMGNIYTVNSLKTILQHEFSNPYVRPHLSFYPDDHGEGMTDSRHGSRWHSALADLACPMARHADGQDYYVHEPALYKPDSNSRLVPVLPLRWYTRDGSLFASARHLWISQESAKPGYFVHHVTIEVPLENFVLAYPRFLEVHERYKLPSPNLLLGEIVDVDLNLHRDWLYPPENPLRKRSMGRKCLSVPLWLYCDDTSGNVSKKWNKLNSWLFNLVGLPPHLSQLPYNIHFLCTSNLAQPLEMLEAILADLRAARKEGIIVFDCVNMEEVLLIPWAFGFEGDNPMQSEFSSHIGLKGTFFCRVCEVRGKDTAARGTGPEAVQARRTEFMTAKTLRTKTQTLQSLEKQLEYALQLKWAPLAKEQTQTGIKDRRLTYFLDQLKVAADKAQKDGKSEEEIINILRALRRSDMPSDLFNPAFRLPDFDPHLHTPVEVLHVFLLGIVKYLWRDAVSRLNTADKEILKVRLSSLDVSGLGLPRLQGHTLVQYAGSLTGRDFRVIVQVGPAVLHDLLPPGLYSMWVAMGRLAPLIFQPKILSLEPYLSSLEEAIVNFLKVTALWNVAWFNKPKFHLLLHLPLHVRLFGPAILFATEGFESFNAVIRQRSTHSNRQAPSRDIAHSFSYMHAVRHLVSGGYFWDEHSSTWRQAGQSVRELVNDVEYQRLMGFEALFNPPGKSDYGRITKPQAVMWSETKVAHAGIQPPTLTPLSENRSILLGESIVLRNKDTVPLNSFVIALFENTPRIARIREILASNLSRGHHLIGVMVQTYRIGDVVQPYELPSLEATEDHALVPLEQLISGVHVMHNCAKNRCEISHTRHVYQERTLVGENGDEYKHEVGPDDLVLNLSQLRNAWILQPLQPASIHSSLSVEETVQKGLALQEERDQAAKAAKDARKGNVASKRPQKSWVFPIGMPIET